MSFKFAIKLCAVIASVIPIAPAASPAITNTIAYAAPALTKAVYTQAAPVYSAPVPVYEHQEAVPAAALHTHVTPTVNYAAPKALVTPASTVAAYTAAAPVLRKPYAPTASLAYVHPAPAVISHVAAPAGLVKTVNYSPANEVSHISFDGFGTHWGF